MGHKYIDKKYQDRNIEIEILIRKYTHKNIDGKFTFLKNRFFKISKIKKYFLDPEKKIINSFS